MNPLSHRQLFHGFVAALMTVASFAFAADERERQGRRLTPIATSVAVTADLDQDKAISVRRLENVRGMPPMIAYVTRGQSRPHNIAIEPNRSRAFFLRESDKNGAALLAIDANAQTTTMLELEKASAFESTVHFQDDRKLLWVLLSDRILRVGAARCDLQSTISVNIPNPEKARCAAVGTSLFFVTFELRGREALWSPVILDIETEAIVRIGPIEHCAVVRIASVPGSGDFAVGRREDLHVPSFGGLSVINGKDGVVKWSRENVFPLWIIAVGDNVIVADGSSNIGVYRAADGALKGTLAVTAECEVVELFAVGDALYLFISRRGALEWFRVDRMGALLAALGDDTQVINLTTD